MQIGTRRQKIIEMKSANLIAEWSPNSFRRSLVVFFDDIGLHDKPPFRSVNVAISDIYGSASCNEEENSFSNLYIQLHKNRKNRWSIVWPEWDFYGAGYLEFRCNWSQVHLCYKHWPLVLYNNITSIGKCNNFCSSLIHRYDIIKNKRESKLFEKIRLRIYPSPEGQP